MKKCSRILAFVLTLVMVVGLMPVSALAEEIAPASAAESILLPGAADIPVLEETPEESAPPAETEEPEATQSPAETEQPEDTETPEATEPPAETEAPEATEAPVIPELDFVLPEAGSAADALIGEAAETEELETPEEVVEEPEEEAAEDGAGDATIVIAGSDYQNTNGGLFSSGAATDAYAIMSQIKEDYDSAYGFLFGGDYYAHSTNTTTESTNGKNQLKNEIVDVLYPDMADDTQIYIQGNHDADILTTNGTLATSGAHDTDYYGVYVINEKDYMWYNDNQTTIQNTASALESYLDEKLTEGFNKPIFVLSHLPLHYSNRTIKEGDGKYAKYIYDVLDEAGANDLNIIFLYGHNHSTSYYEEYLGNAAVYLAEGDTIYIANEGSQSSCFSDTLNFTYMNYGFTGYLTGTAADGALTMTVFEIYEDEVKVKRYDESGVHNLKSAGTNGSTPAGTVYNTTVYTSPQTIELTTPEAKNTLTSNGVTVSAAGITAVTASKAESPTYNSSLYSGYEEYTVSAEGYETGKTATVTIALTDGDFDTSRTVTVKFPDGHTEEVAISNGTVTVKADALGTFTLMQKVQTQIEIPGDSGSDTGDGTIWRQVTSFTAGKNYMLVNYGDNASGIGTFAVNSTAGGTAVTVQTDSTGAYIENSNMALAWTYNSNAELTNADTNQYLYIASYPSDTDGVKVNVTDSVTTGTSYSSWKRATNTGLNEVSLSAYRNGSSNYYPARWSNGGQEYLAYTSTQTSKHDNWIAIFEQTSEGGSASGPTVETSGGDWVTITEPTGGTTTYTYTQAISITAGEKYVIVANDNEIALMDNDGNMGTQSVTINGTTMTSTTALTEWTFSGSSSGTVHNGTRYLRYSTSGMSGSFNLSTSSSTLTFTDNGSNFRIYNNASYGTDYSFYYNGRSWTRSSSTQYVRLYQLTGTTTTGGSNGLYGKIDGELTYTVPYGTTETVALNKVKAGIAIKYATASDYSDEQTYADDGEGMRWEVVDYDGNTPGEYAVKIYYNETLLGTAKIVVNAAPAGTAQVTIDSDAGSVRQNAGVAALTGNKLTLTYEDGTTETVNVTVGMVKNADGTTVNTSVPGTYTGLKVVYTYGGVEYTVCDNYTLTVRENVQNNYPEYPDEGAVKVNKTATGIDFQSSGIAQVELSASGVPSKKGVDVIVMVDTSSSMKRGAGTNVEVSAPNRRIDFLQTALANLIREFQGVGDDGEQLDINVAIAEFNGYDFISSGDHPTGTSQQGASNVAEVFTGDGSKTAGAFVQATTIADPDAFAANIGFHSGTNYDYAFDTIYRLGAAINAQNAANGEERDLFVIFMSDGAPYGYNYYGSGTTNAWDNYLNGTLDVSALEGNTHFYRTDGKHWMAEAVKGATDQTYMVIDPTDSLGADATADNVTVYEEAGIILTEGETSYFRMVPGLGAEVHAIGFCLYDDEQSGGTVTATTQKALMQRLASVDSNGNVMYHETVSGSDLNDIFCEIASQIAYAANNARFEDQMGENFDLQLKTATYTVVETVNGEDKEVEKTLAPVIEIGTYSIYTRQDYLDGLCTEAQIGDRTGAFKLTEVVKFSDDGTKAYSSLIDVDGKDGYGVTVNADGTYTISDTKDNIIGDDGVIYAKSFMYNTGTSTVTVNGVTLAPEQFYWYLGTVETSELAMRYYVYLTGSMEGKREAGSYATNESAVLYYDNYLGNPCSKDTVSPVVAWKEANVSYAFYLVNENGEVVVNQTTGATGTFANKVAVTRPVVYETVLLNNDEEVSSLDIASMGVLPEGYKLYDYNGTDGASYTVTINSDSTGEWEITSVKNVATTYVMQHDPNNASAYSNEKNVDTLGYDYTHTVVWFAVIWVPSTIPDAVVVDYGLPVDIHVLHNDQFGENGKLNGIGTAKPAGITDSVIYTGTPAEDYVKTSLSLNYGTVTYPTSMPVDYHDVSVRYTPNENAMKMAGYDKFVYEVAYTSTGTGGVPQYYYGDVKVIPATTIYFEDSYVDEDGNEYSFITFTGAWENADGKAADSKVQNEDRPGEYSLPAVDANNVYGSDAAYAEMANYSLNSAKVVNVSAANNPNAGGTGWPTAQFTFTGTGFDIISLTSNTTGTIRVQVFEGSGTTTQLFSWIVDTYYGYAYDKDTDEWIEVENDPNALYQVPVIKSGDNITEWGTYTVLITPMYAAGFDHNDAAEGYDFYLDAIRVYNPAGSTGVNTTTDTTDTTIQNAYIADHEYMPDYYELRNWVIDAETFNALDEGVTLEGVLYLDRVFTDGATVTGAGPVYTVADYAAKGPNNELYLEPGQAVVFDLNTTAPNGYEVDTVQIAVKSVGGTTKAKCWNTDLATADTAVQKTIETATDMYYNITHLNSAEGKTVVIMNSGAEGDAVLSITNIKVTYKPVKEETAGTDTVNLDGAAGDIATETAIFTVSREVVEEAIASITGDAGKDETTTEPDEEETEIPGLEELLPAVSLIKKKILDVTNNIQNILSGILGRWGR